jgi:hypothetical protein
VIPPGVLSQVLENLRGCNLWGFSLCRLCETDKAIVPELLNKQACYIFSREKV